MRLKSKRFYTRRAGGSGWVYGDDGERYWGAYGAAGLLLRARAGEEILYLLLHRSYSTHHGGSWGIPGGAIARDEEPIEAAIRELWEETGLLLPEEAELVQAVRHHPVFDWSYTTFTFQIEEPLELDAMLSEHSDALWLTKEEASLLNLHPLFAGPFLLDLLG